MALFLLLDALIQEMKDMENNDHIQKCQAVRKLLVQFEEADITTINEAIIHLDEEIYHATNQTGIKCPKCGRKVKLITGKYASAYVCECEHAWWRKE